MSNSVCFRVILCIVCDIMNYSDGNKRSYSELSSEPSVSICYGPEMKRHEAHRPVYSNDSSEQRSVDDMMRHPISRTSNFGGSSSCLPVFYDQDSPNCLQDSDDLNSLIQSGWFDIAFLVGREEFYVINHISFAFFFCGFFSTPQTLYVSLSTFQLWSTKMGFMYVQCVIRRFSAQRICDVIFVFIAVKNHTVVMNVERYVYLFDLVQKSRESIVILRCLSFQLFVTLLCIFRP